MSRSRVGNHDSERTMNPVRTVNDGRVGPARRARRWLAMAGALLLTLATAATATAAPRLEIGAAANTVVEPGGTLIYLVTVENTGDVETDGSLVEFTGSLPGGFTVSTVFLSAGPYTFDCSGTVPGSQAFTCTTTDVMPVNFPAFFQVEASVDPTASGTLTSSFGISGGGASPASTVDATRISTETPGFGFDAFDGQLVADPAGNPFTQAAGRPFAISTNILLNTFTHPTETTVWPVEPLKNLSVELPPGLVGNPTALGQCTFEQMANPTGPLCPTSSQVGIVNVRFNGNPVLTRTPVFNIVPPDDVAARFAFSASGSLITLDAAVRTGSDYGLTVMSRNAPEAVAITGVNIEFWGYPADPIHDPERACPGGGFGCATEAQLRPFLRNTTSCTPLGVGLETRVRADSWYDPGDFATASFVSHLPPAFPFPSTEWGDPQGPTGCEDVPFDATLTAVPAVPARANTPSGFAFDLSIPQNDDAIAQSDLKKAVVTLPEGVRVSPPSAQGLEGCASSEIALSSATMPSCPDGSKIGSLTIETPLLKDELKGSVYLAKPFDNPSNTLLGLYLVAKGPGIVIKLPGRVDADPETGQLTTTFDNNPQLPFSNLHLEFDNSSRTALVLPRRCGTYTTHAVLTGWSGKTAVSDSSFDIDVNSKGVPCPATPQFSPDLEAGTVSPVAGTHSPFVLNLSRDDVDEELRTLSIDMPAGLLAKIKGVPRCPAAQAAAGTCGEGSRVGSVTTGAGAGATPFFLGGEVFFSGPYKGAPFSLSIVVPAVAGPFDLGTVVVRAAIHVDRKTTALRVVSDPLPTILQGIPLQIREVRVLIDRERFILNPTSCKVKSIGATVGSTEGSTAKLSDRFQVGDCGRLPLRPRMSLRVGAKGRTHANGATPLVTTLRQSPGQTGLKSVGVQLPLIINGRLDVINDACTPEQFEQNAAKNCANARTGVAVARTPLLADPLKGSVYFVEKPSGRGLPNLVVALRGEVDVDLVGTIKIPSSNKLGTVFKTIPDVPVSSFKLTLFAGRNGAIGLTKGLCSRAARRATASLRFVGQNGKHIAKRQRLRIRGCGNKTGRR
jgi:uncharacterized repeat protein (TIGR01451 family)